MYDRVITFFAALGFIVLTIASVFEVQRGGYLQIAINLVFCCVYVHMIYYHGRLILQDRRNKKEQSR